MTSEPETGGNHCFFKMCCGGSKVSDEKTAQEDKDEKNDGSGPPSGAPNPFECGKALDITDPLQSMFCGCHSFYCFLIFIAAWVALWFICLIAMQQGDLNRLYRGFDSFGNVCNVKIEKQLDGAIPKLDLDTSPYLYYVYMDPASYTPIEIPALPGGIEARPTVYNGDTKKQEVIKELSFCVGKANFLNLKGEKQTTYPCPSYAHQGRAYYLDSQRYKNNEERFIVPLEDCINPVKGLAEVYRGALNVSINWCYKVGTFFHSRLSRPVTTFFSSLHLCLFFVSSMLLRPANSKQFMQYCAPEMYDNSSSTYYCADNETSTDYKPVEKADDCKKTLVTFGLSKSTASDRDQSEYLDAAYKGKQSGLSAILMGMVADVGNASTVLIYACVGSFLLGILWLLVLRYFAGCIVWTAILGTIIGSFYVSFWIYGESMAMSNDGDTGNDKKAEIYLYISYAGFVITLAEICMVIFLRRAIMLAIAVVKLATSAMRDMPALSFYPIIPYIFLLIETFFFVYFMALLASSGTLTQKGQMRYFTFDEDLQKLMAYHLFIFLWTANFICDAGSITIGMSAALWYFTPNPMIANEEGFKGYVAPPVRPAYKKSDESTSSNPVYICETECVRFGDSDFPTIKPKEPQQRPKTKAELKAAADQKAKDAPFAEEGATAPEGEEEEDFVMDESYYKKTWDGRVPCCGMVCTAMWFIFRYFVGVVAMGSFIVAVVQFIRAVVMYVQSQLDEYKDNKIVKCIFCMINCCLWCVEKCMKFITKNSYIQAVIWDLGFCEACLSSFRFIMRNMGRMAAMGYVANVLVLLGQAFVVSITTAGCAVLLNELLKAGTITSIYLPLFLVIIISYFIGYTFLSVYQMVMDTLLQCVVTDEEVSTTKLPNGDAPDTFMNDSLQSLLDRCKSEQKATEMQNSAGTKVKEEDAREVEEEPAGEE